MKTRVFLGALLAMTLAACTGGEQRSAVQATKEGKPCRGGLAEFLAAGRVVYDYEPADTPAALARQADAVVTGTIVAVNPGQSYPPAPGRRPDVTTSVLEGRVDQVVAGDRALVTDGSVYIEVDHSAFGRRAPFDHAAFAATFPSVYGVFFLADRTDDSYSDTAVDEGAGRPAGARLTATYVQGFLIENACGKLVSVWDSFESMPPAWRGLDSVDDVVAALR